MVGGILAKRSIGYLLVACIFKASCIFNASCIFSVLQIFVIRSADHFLRTVIEFFLSISAVWDRTFLARFLQQICYKTRFFSPLGCRLRSFFTVILNHCLIIGWDLEVGHAAVRMEGV